MRDQEQELRRDEFRLEMTSIGYFLQNKGYERYSDYVESHGPGFIVFPINQFTRPTFITIRGLETGNPLSELNELATAEDADGLPLIFCYDEHVRAIYLRIAYELNTDAWVWSPKGISWAMKGVDTDADGGIRVEDWTLDV